MNRKSVVVVSMVCALFSVSSALAEAPKTLRPKTVTCTSEAEGPAGNFRIENFDSKVPEPIMDASTDGEIEVNQFTTSFCANNGCDNDYCYVFVTDELDQLARGKVASAKGLLRYADAYMKEGTEEAATAVLTCTVAK